MDTGGGELPLVQQPATATAPALDSGAYDPSLDNSGGPDIIATSAQAMVTVTQPAFTDPSQATVPISPATSPVANTIDVESSPAALTQADATTILPTSAAASDTLAQSTSLAPYSSSQSASASSTSMSMPSAAATLAPVSGGPHFKITYLIPVFVLLGLLLLLAIGGKIWGRVSFAKERATKRNERRRQEAQQIANETRNAYMQPWQEKGWAAFDASMEMQRDGQDLDARSDGGDEAVRNSMQGSPSKYGVQLYDGPAPYQSNDSDGDASEHDLRGPLSAIGTHLAGQRFGQRAPPPPARIEHDRFKPQLAANSWWSVQWSRHFGHGAGSGSYGGLENVYAGQQKSSAATAAKWVASQQENDARLALQIQRRRTKRGVLARMKSRLGWGYDGTSPLIGVQKNDHAFVMPPQAPMYWSRIPQAEDEVLAAGDMTQPACEQWPQPYGRPMDEEPNLNRTLPPTPMTAIDTPTPWARKRVQDVRAFQLSRAQTQSTISSIKRMANVKPVARSSTVAAPHNRPMISPSGAVMEDSDEEDEKEMVRQVRQIKSLNAMADLASASDRERATDKASALQRNKTMGPLKRGPKKHNVHVLQGDTQSKRRDGVQNGVTGSFRRQTVRKPVNFGDYSDEDEDIDKENIKSSSNLPALDSFLLSRTMSVKSRDHRGVGMVLSDYEGSDVFSPETDGEVVMELGRKYSTNYSEHSAISSLPALSRGSTMTHSSVSSRRGSEEDAFVSKGIKSYTPVTNTDEIGAEIDHALLRIIARSNTSKSFARSVGGFASAVASPVQREPMDKAIGSNNGTPIGRTGTWRKDQGRWTKSSPNAHTATVVTPVKSPISPMPPPLPTPPLAVLPRALLAASPSRKSFSQASRRESAAQLSSETRAVQQRSSRQAMQQPLPTHLGQKQNFGTSHAKIGRDLFFSQGDDPAKSVKEALLAEVRRSAAIADESATSSRTPTERSQSTRSSVFSSASEAATTQSSTLLTESDLYAPMKRRTAMAKRGLPPQRYTAKLSGGDDDQYLYDEQDAVGVISNYQRLHTGKSLRTPAEKRREQTYAMDRVQSILTRARASQPDINL
jgi:hypothetical protein